MAHIGKRVLEETRLDTHLMILDYCLFMATKALLEEQVIKHEEGEDENLSETPLQMVDSFIRMFKVQHPHDDVPDTTKLRLRLVKFTTLYGRRLTQSSTTPSSADLEALRRTHKRRADEWWDDGSDGSPQQASFQHIRRSSGCRSATEFRASTTSISFSDLVPLFIGLSAARSNLQINAHPSIMQTWMHLAGQFMLQAAIEQVLVFGQVSPEKLREIFSWGWKENMSTAWQDERSVNNMFFDMDHYEQDGSMREVPGWREIKRCYMKMLTPSGDVDLSRHLRRLQKRFALRDFEDQLLLFLEALQLEQEEPFLVQLESGTVPGMSADEMAAFRKRVRLPF